jgi:6-phosphogluconolactonase
MRTRFPWMVAILALVAIGFLVACSTKYKSTSNGLIVVPTQGTEVMETFSLDLSNGHVSQINNVNGPPTPGLPGAVVLDPAGTFAYVILNQNSTSAGGIATFKVAADGKLSYIATTAVTSPLALTIDSAGKLLFVSNGPAGTVSVFSIGANAALTQVAGSPFTLPAEAGGGGGPSAAALAVTPTVFPVQFAPCSGHAPPASENLYVADSVNNVLLNYLVSSSGGLGLVSASATSPGVLTGTLPSGVAVDSCGQFAYVANETSNSVSAFTICTAISQNCVQPDYSLQPVAGSPYPVGGDAPGPIAVDPFAKYVYVVDTGSSQLSAFRISPSNGSLTAIANTPVSTGSGANSIAIRADGSWIFVANLNAATVSQYAITQATGALTPQSPFTTLNYPSGVAVK